MDRFDCELKDLTTSAKLLGLDLEKSDRTLNNQEVTTDSLVILSRKLEETVAIHAQLAHSLQAVSNKEKDLIALLGILDEDQQASQTVRLTEAKEQLKLDSIAARSYEVLERLLVRQKRIKTLISNRNYLSDDDSIGGNSAKPDRKIPEKMLNQEHKMEPSGEPNDGLQNPPIVESLQLELNDLREKMNALLNNRRWNDTEYSSLNQHLSHTRDSKLKRPQLSLPTFDGTVANFNTYWTSFQTVIDSDPTLSLREKALYLGESLKGKAREHIQGIVLNEYTYATILNTLKASYKKHIPDKWRVYNKLAAMKPAGTTAGDARQKARDIRCLLDQLATEQIYDSDEVAWITTIIHQFPSVIVEKVFQSTSANETIGSAITEIEKQITALANMETYRASRFNTSPKFKEEKRQQLSISTGCPLCGKSGHKAFQCRTITSAEERRNTVKEKKLCWKCFNSNHSSKECKMSDCPACNQPHHSSLCLGPRKPRPNIKADTSSHTVAALTKVTYRPQTATLMTAELQIHNNRTNNVEPIVVFFDPGATRSFIVESRANQLGLKIGNNTSTIHTAGFGMSHHSFLSHAVTVQLKSTFGHIIELPTQTTPRLVESLEAAQLTANDMNFVLQHNFQLANTKIGGEALTPELLIGMDVFMSLVYGSPIKLPSGLSLQPTLFGMAICGSKDNLPTQTEQREHINTVVLNTDEKTEQQMIKELFELDSLGIHPDQGTLKKADEFYNFYGKQMTFHKGYLEAPLPLKENHIHLQNNYRVAGKVFYRLMESLQRNPDQYDWYKKIMDDYLKKGIIEIAPPREVTSQSYFMPHRGVWRPEKSTPLRIVFNCSSRMKGALSLNDVLHTGSSYVNKIMDVLIACRSTPYFLCCDIQSAFTQIRLTEDHKRFCHFLWMKDTSKPVSPSNVLEMRFNRIVFGMTTSPSILNIGLASFLKHQRTAIADEMLKNLYVDNILMTANTPEECFKKYHESKRMLGAIDMNIREYLSNSDQVNSMIPTEDKYPAKQCRILGVDYDPNQDTFSICMNWKKKKAYTKRDLLSQLHSLYDPLGLAAPLLIHFKQILRTVFDLKIEWKDAVPETINEQWNSILKDVNDQNIAVQRTLPPESEIGTIWIFADASTTATAVCAYFSYQDKQSQLIIGKTKLAPRNRILTIPRLELIALHMAVNLGKTMNDAISKKAMHFHFLSDSQIALSWLKTRRALPTFVANMRDKINHTIRQIRESGASVQLSYVDTNHNPADIGSRGWKAKNLQGSSWVQGPSWICKSPTHWPIMDYDNIKTDENEEDVFVSIEKTKHEIHFEEPFNNLPEKKLNMALRIVTRIKRWCHKQTHIMGAVTGTDMIEATKTLIKAHQQQTRIAGSSVKYLRVFLDEVGIERIASRITDTAFPYEVRNPIILNKTSSLTRQLIQQLHEEHHHIGIEHTLALFRRTYYAQSARQIVKKVISSCQKCRMRRLTPYDPNTLGPLPKDRTGAQHVFQHVGVDALGPLHYVQDQKVYVLLFTCLTVRAIHLEPINSLSGEAFLLAFSRFISRRGVPTIMRSDNGGNFLMADNIIKLLHQPTTVEGKSTMSFIAQKKIQWIFNTPGAPWTGGAWERLVRSVKNSIQKGVQARKLSGDQLATTLCKAEAIINSRPLTYTSEDSLALRPIDFLIPRATLEVFNVEQATSPTSSFVDVDVISRKTAIESLARIEECLSHFWKRFQLEYLPNLRNLYGQGKGSEPATTPKVGDIVIIQDDRMKKGEWNLGRVIEVLPASDGRIRTVRVLGHNGMVSSKPITVLYPTELRAQSHMVPPVVSHKHQHLKRNVVPYPIPARNRTDIPTSEEELVNRPLVDHSDQHEDQRVKKLPNPVREREATDSFDIQLPRTMPKATPPPMVIPDLKAQAMKRFKWNPLYTVITILALTISSTTAMESQATCNQGVLKIPASATEVKVCIHNQCREIQKGRDTIITLPVLAHEDLHTIRIKQHKQWINLTCEGTDLCIHATVFSLQLLGNPHCNVALAIVSTLIPFVLLATIIVATRVIIHIQRKNKPRITRYEPSLFQQTTRVVVIAMMINISGACVLEHERDMISYTCENNVCIANFNKDIMFNPTNKKACVNVLVHNVSIASIKIEILETNFLCHKKVMFYTRETITGTPYNFACPGSNRCSLLNKCEDYKGTVGEELFEASKLYPGTMNCNEVDGGLLRGCPIMGKACLITRVGYEPINEDVHEIFSCATWSQEHVFRITTVGLDKVRAVQLLTAQPYESIQLPHFRLSVLMSSEKVIHQYAAERFIRSRNMTARLPHYISPKVLCSSYEQAEKNFSSCTMTEKCICGSTKQPPQCKCHNMDFGYIADNHALPIQGKQKTLRKRGQTIGATSTAEEVLVSVDSISLEQSSLMRHGSDCKTKLELTKGCYNCAQGMLIVISCWAQSPETHLTNCQDQLFTLECAPESQTNKLLFYADSPIVEFNCTTSCGRSTSVTTIKATLTFIPEKLLSLEGAVMETTTDSEHSDKKGWLQQISFPNLLPIKQIIVSYWKEYASMVIGLLIIIGILLTLGPRIIVLIMELLLTLIQKIILGCLAFLCKKRRN